MREKTGLLSGRLSALDGIRGLAVLAVLAYHAGLNWAPGGLLGVDVFFVLSGFLITSLLVAEWQRSGTIRLGSFWARRARRLLPALLVLLVGVAAYAWLIAGPDQLHQLRLDALSTLAYVANWRFVASSQGYFAHTALPSPLLHTWSLAVEEQFYLIWPLMAVVVLARFGRRGLAWVAGLGAVGSAVLMAVLFRLGASSSRLYYGTDTRAQALLVGATLALVGFRWCRAPRQLVAGVGVAGLSILVWAWGSVGGQSPWLYEGGFLLVALGAAGVIASVALRPGAALARALGWGPLAYVGRISYGLYLYHWPLFLVLDHTRTHLSGAGLLALRLGVTFGLSVISFHLWEAPIRARQRIGAVITRLSVPSALITVSALVVAATVAPGLAGAAPSGGGPVPISPRVASFELVHPVNALVVGDSIGLTLSIGLSYEDRPLGVAIDSKAVLGCDVDWNTSIRQQGKVTLANQQCAHWPATWAGFVRAQNPDVVMVVMGRWDTYDHYLNGRWTHIGNADFDVYLAGELRQAVGILSSRGATVALATLPCVSPAERPDGGTWPENLPARVNAYNSVLRSVAASMPTQARIIDVNAILCPQGDYAATVQGVLARTSDGIHTTPAGGEVVGETVLPQLARLGLAHDQARVHQLSRSGSTATRQS